MDDRAARDLFDRLLTRLADASLISPAPKRSDAKTRHDRHFSMAIDRHFSMALDTPHVPGAFGLDHIRRHAQADLTVDRPAASGLLAVVVLGDDLVAEESSGASAEQDLAALAVGLRSLADAARTLAESTALMNT